MSCTTQNRSSRENPATTLADSGATVVIVLSRLYPVLKAARANTAVAHVIVTHPQVPDDNLQLYRMFGAIFGRREQADALMARYATGRDALLDAIAAVPDALIRRIVRAQEGDGGLQHLQTRLATRQPVILVFQGHQLDRLAGTPERA